MATTRTTRKCPWCGEHVRLAHAPIVATNFEGSRHGVDLEGGSLGGGEFAHGKHADLGVDEDFVFFVDDSEAAVGFDEPVAGDDQAVVAESTPDTVPVSGNAVLGHAGGLPIVAAPQIDPVREGRFSKMVTRRLHPVADVADARDLPARACTSCHHPLPFDVDDREVIILSVLGINRAGKTYLLATGLYEAIHHTGLARAGISDFTADEATANRFHRDYYLPVFRRRDRLDPTQDPSDGEAVEPMIFRFEAGGEKYLLALHDLAGEAIAEPARRATVAPFVRHSDGIVFVVDPLEIEAVRTKLPFEQITVDWRGWNQLDVLRGCVESLGDRAAEVPVSVVLTKSDLIGLAEGERFRFAKAADGDWLEDQYAVDREVRGLLRRWDVPQFEQTADRASRGFFHAVSAFGAPPTDPRTPGVLSPVRTADPFGTLINLLAEARG